MRLAHGFLFVVCTIAETLAHPHPIPPGWTLHRRAEPKTRLLVRISLVQSNLRNLDAYLLDIADPQSPNYGQHWSPQQVLDTFRSSQDSIDIVQSWLSSELGPDTQSIRLSPNGGVVELNITVAEAERVFATEYNVYRWGEDDSEHVGWHQGHKFPLHVSEHVDFVWPTLTHGGRRLRTRSRLPPAARRSHGLCPVENFPIYSGVEHCDKAVTLDCLRALYDFDYELVAGHRNSVGVAEFGTNYYRPEDLDMFFKKFAPEQVGHRPKLVTIAGGHLNESDPSCNDFVEASLDLELMMGLLGHKQEVLLYQTSASNTDPNGADELLAAWDAMYCSNREVAKLGLKDCGDVPRANVISISYTPTPDIQDVFPILERECAEIGKLGLMGITVIASSGDVGVAFRDADFVPECLVNGSLQRLKGNQTGSFVGAFPASCPYVTAVGATQVSPGKSVRHPETAVFNFSSGGGFSNVFPRPHFQNHAVSNYLKHFAPPYGPNVFNRSGRAYPDVSANGWPTIIAAGGNFIQSGGTSASAPIVASFIAAINDARIAIGKRPVGWINPALYSRWFADSFNDVTSGTNPGCGTEGFPAARGWDPVTGLGTPNFRRLLDNFLALP